MSHGASMSVDNTRDAYGSVVFTPNRPINISKGPYLLGVRYATIVDGWSLLVGTINIKHNHDTFILCPYDIYRSQTKLREDNVFNRVGLSVCLFTGEVVLVQGSAHFLPDPPSFHTHTVTWPCPLYMTLVRSLFVQSSSSSPTNLDIFKLVHYETWTIGE